jgi:hypothetical protein
MVFMGGRKVMQKALLSQPVNPQIAIIVRVSEHI